MEPTYYRGCWHEVCSPLFHGYSITYYPLKAVYRPKPFFLHAASLDQAFAHCRIFSTAATRRCTDRISVPSLKVVLSHLLPVIALVSRYLTNKLIGPRPLQKRIAPLLVKDYRELADLSTRYARLLGMYQGVTNSFATIPLQLLLTGEGPFDLHALSTPPAFILSQDQTLLKKVF